MYLALGRLLGGGLLALSELALVELEDDVDQQNAHDDEAADDEHLLLGALDLDHARGDDFDAGQLEVGEVLEHGEVARRAHVVQEQELFVDVVARVEVVRDRLEDVPDRERVLRNGRVDVLPVRVVDDVQVLLQRVERLQVARHGLQDFRRQSLLDAHVVFLVELEHDSPLLDLGHLR